MVKRSLAQLFSPVGILGAIVLSAVTFQNRGMAGDPGVGWHLVTGLAILRDGVVPATDPFGTGRPWIHTQWLSDAGMGAVFELGGWPGLELAAILIGFLSCFVFLPLCLRRLKLGSFPIAVGALVATFLFAIQWIVRPVILSFLLFGVVFVVLNPRQRLRRYQLFLIPLFMLWANLHPAFLFGFLPFVALGLSQLVEGNFRGAGRTALLGSASFISTGVNPYGFNLHLQSFALSGSRFFQNLHQEWLSPDFHLIDFSPLLLASGLILHILVFTRHGNSFERVVLALLLIFSLQGRRYAPFMTIPLGYFAAVLVAAQLPAERFKLLNRQENVAPLCLALAVMLLLYVGYFGHLPGRSAESSDPLLVVAPKLERCKKHGGRRVLASPDLGGAVIFHGLTPVIDDRNELYGEEAYRRYLDYVNARSGWREIFKEYSPDCVIREKGAPVNYFLSDYGF
jgi:hypothetical protein